MTALRAVPEPEPVGAVHLTPREQRALEIIAAGGEIADVRRELGYADSSAKNLVNLVIARLNATNRAQAVHEAHRRGLLSGKPRAENDERLIAAMRSHIEKLERKNARLEAQKADALQALLREG